MCHWTLLVLERCPRNIYIYILYLFQQGCDLLLAMDNFDPPPINLDYVKLLEAKQGCSVNLIECMAEINMYNKLYKQYYSCSLCGMRFTDQCNRNRHRRKVDCTNKVIRELDDKPKNRWKCKVCRKWLSLRSSRDRHQRTVHCADHKTVSRTVTITS